MTPGSVSRPAASRLLARDRAARTWLRVAVLAGVGAAVALIIQLAAVALVVADVFLAGGTLEEQSAPLVLAFLLLAVRAVLVVARELAARRAAERLVGTLRAELTDQLLQLGPAWLSEESSGELGGVLGGGLETLEEYVAVYLPSRWLAVVVPLLVLLVVLALDPPSVAVLLFTGPLLLMLLVVIGGRTEAITQRRFLEMRTLSAFFLDILRGLPTLRMFGRGREQVENLRRISAHYGDATMDVLRVAFQTSLVLEWGATIAIALIAVEVGLRLLHDDIAFDRALAVLLITPEFFLPLRLLAMRFHLGTTGEAATARVFQILDEPVVQASVAPARARAHACEPVLAGPPEILFEAVTYRYPTRARPALEAVSFRVPAGRSVAVVGASGAGKSTAASLLLRFMEPSEGCITADGRRLTELTPAAWRAFLAWVPQRPHLFAGSVADNIRLARRDADDEAVASAARAANAAAFIERLPDGYETLLGEAGARLSGGQRQRLAIARAFLRDAPFLMLDEATSYQDEASETAIAEAIARLSVGRTVLVIAHRLRLAEWADEVVVLDTGRVVESGAPADLLAHGGAYARLVGDRLAGHARPSSGPAWPADGARTSAGRAS